MTSFCLDLLAGFIFLVAVSIMSLAYIFGGTKIIEKQGHPSDRGSETEEQDAAKRNHAEKEAGLSTAPQKNHFDVFISFRGKDTRNGFTSHLDKEFVYRGIKAFIDSEDLEKGNIISDLFKKMEGSKIFVRVFSQNYADSKWCLREIAKMVEINKREGDKRPIIPIFYHVDPFELRHCKESFEKAFKKHQQDKELGKEEISGWKAALAEAGNLSGHCLSQTEGNEAKVITIIGKQVSRMLSKVPFDFVIEPIGLRPRIDTLKRMLNREKDGVCMIGICGLGGIGKTTTAKALYNELSSMFERSCFLSDIRGNESRRTLSSLQAEFMNEVLKENMTMGNVEQGVSLMKQRLGSKKILLILDDVDHTRQLEAFIANRRNKEEWFGAGSKIIVTTRDKQVLAKHGLLEEEIYFPKALDGDHSLQLFCRHAFGRDQPLPDFHDLSQEVVKIAQGLPLAVIVFGSLLYDLQEKEEWEEILKKLKSDQNKEVHERLKISYGWPRRL